LRRSAGPPAPPHRNTGSASDFERALVESDARTSKPRRAAAPPLRRGSSPGVGFLASRGATTHARRTPLAAGAWAARVRSARGRPSRPGELRDRTTSDSTSRSISSRSRSAWRDSGQIHAPGCAHPGLEPVPQSVRPVIAEIDPAPVGDDGQDALESAVGRRLPGSALASASGTVIPAAWSALRTRPWPPLGHRILRQTIFRRTSSSRASLSVCIPWTADLHHEGAGTSSPPGSGWRRSVAEQDSWPHAPAADLLAERLRDDALQRLGQHRSHLGLAIAGNWSMIRSTVTEPVGVQGPKTRWPFPVSSAMEMVSSRASSPISTRRDPAQRRAKRGLKLPVWTPTSVVTRHRLWSGTNSMIPRRDDVSSRLRLM